MKVKNYSGVLVIGLMVGCGSAKAPEPVMTNPEILYQHTKNLDAMYALFPKTVRSLNERVDHILKEAQQRVDAIIALSSSDRTFENTARALDTAVGEFSINSAGISTLTYVSPDDSLREAAELADVRMGQAAIDIFGQNIKLYKAFKAYYDGNYKKEHLSPVEHYFVEEAMKDFKQSGFDLPDDKRQELIALKKELSQLTTTFEKNVNTNTSSFTASQEELAGVDPDLVANLKRTDDGKYVVGVDYPTFFGVMRYATNENTRKRMSRTMNTRAYPANMDVLHKIIEKRDQMARLLGYKSFAHYNIDGEMAETPEKAEAFICDVITKARKKADLEFEQLKSDLAPSVILSPEGKMYPWNGAFTRAWYKQKHYQIDEREISEYFPMEQTVERLLDIYQSFFALTMHQQKVNGLWVDDLTLITVRSNKDNQLLGYLILDLYPRKNKYGHACHIGISPALMADDGSRVPSFSVVLTNFPKSTAEKPSLLTRSDAATFFHEFGHAIHAILGATELATQSGTHVKRDFVEMPSQMLEEWLYDKEILKQVSGHYKTGKPLTDELIAKIIELKNFDQGTQLIGQANSALFALKCFCPGGCKDTDALNLELHELTMHHSVHDPESHFQSSFGHLTGYGARYYGYLWSQVYALDLFEHIKKYGLTNPEIGTVYAQKVLGKGGSQHPMELLKDFLGREPNTDAFMKNLGL